MRRERKLERRVHEFHLTYGFVRNVFATAKREKGEAESLGEEAALTNRFNPSARFVIALIRHV